jgi:hypothetical protein
VSAQQNQKPKGIHMAIVLEANYAKKLGLPNFSSHQYSVTIRTELTDLGQVETESARLYRLLQDAVDREIEHVGFMPDATTYGMNNGNGNDHAHPNGNGNGRTGNGHTPPANGNGGGDTGAWKCSDRQRELIQKIVREKSLDKADVEKLAQEMFDKGVKGLNKLEASALIDELLDRHGGGRHSGRKPYRRERAPAGRGDDQ